MKKIALCLMIFWLAACGPTSSQPVLDNATETFTPFAPIVKKTPTLIPEQIKPTRTATARPSLTLTLIADTVTPTITPIPPCYFNWAYQDLPEVSQQFEAVLRAALGDALVRATAGAYGENCYAYDTNQVVYFAAMETDYYVTLAVANINDDEALGNLVMLIFPALEQFPVGSTPGGNPGIINLIIQSGEQTRYLNFPRKQIEALQGLTGAALITALSARP
jgi:hypothetical protein